MRIIRFDKDRILPHTHPAILVRRGIVKQPGTHWPMVLPQLASGPRIQSKHIVGRGHEHYTSNYYWCCFQILGVAGMEDPGSPQLVDICGTNFSQSAIAASGVVPVV